MRGRMGLMGRIGLMRRAYDARVRVINYRLPGDRHVKAEHSATREDRERRVRELIELGAEVIGR